MTLPAFFCLTARNKLVSDDIATTITNQMQIFFADSRNVTYFTVWWFVGLLHAVHYTIRILYINEVFQ